MSAAVHEDVDYAHTRGAEHNRVLKARQLARWLWERDLSYDDVLAADDARRRSWARAAKVSPPSTMDTWEAVRGTLAVAVEFARGNPDHPAAQRPHAGERATWLGQVPEPTVDAPAVHNPVDDTADVAAAPEVVFPRGWDALAALGPVDRLDARCARCRRPAITAVRCDGIGEWRCAGHPPQPGEWGAALDWTPRAGGGCAPNRCYCSRCPGFKLTTIFRVSDSALLDERAAAKGKNRAPVHVRQAAIAAENARKANRHG